MISAPKAAAPGADGSANRPLYRQVYDILLGRITAGTWRVGMLLPSEQALARELGVSHGTVRKGLDLLEQAKLVERQQGRGTFVCTPALEIGPSPFDRLGDPARWRMHRLGCPKSSIAETSPPEEVAAALGINRTTPVFLVRRVRTLNDRPVAVESIIVPTARVPGLDQHQPLPASLYHLYRDHYRLFAQTAREAISAGGADTTVAEALNIAPSTPILSVKRLSIDVEQKPFEWRQSYVVTEAMSYLSEIA